LGTTNYTLSKFLKHLLLINVLLLIDGFVFAQQTPTAQDTTKTGFSLGHINMPNPESIVSKYTYDPLTDRYIY
jgi:hypothetical protein